MDQLIKQAEARVLEENRKRWRQDKDGLIVQYESVIKKAIETFYAAHPTEIARIIQVCAELKTCKDGAQCARLASEVEAFKKLIPDMWKELKLYERLHGYDGRRLFPRAWDAEVAQEWLCYWNYPMVLGGTAMMEKYRTRTIADEMPGNTYIAEKKAGTVPLEFDQDYKGENIWIDLPKTLLECHTWRARYNLQHLDAIVLHTK